MDQVVSRINLPMRGESLAGSPYVQMVGFRFSVAPRVADSSDSYIVESAEVEMITVLVRDIFTTRELVPTVFMQDSRNHECYTDGNVFCKVFDTYTDGTLRKVNVGCSNMATYVNESLKLSPLYEAYAARYPGVRASDRFFMRGTDIMPSKVDGYHKAILAQGDMYGGAGIGFFYQTPDGIWHYFTGTQQPLMCTDFNTPDVRNASTGEECQALVGGNYVTNMVR